MANRGAWGAVGRRVTAQTWVLGSLFGALVVLTSGGTALAQTARPAGVRVTQADWVYVPVVIEDQGVCGVPGVLALRDPAAAIGANIVAIWYENPGVPGADWASVAWTTSNPWEAIKWVKAEYGIDDEWDDLWPAGSASPAESFANPAEYTLGLMADDPLQMITSDPQGVELVALLTDLGYQSASVPIDPHGTCDKSVVLAALADTASYAMCEQPPLDQVEARYAAQVSPTCPQMSPLPQLKIRCVPIGRIPGTPAVHCWIELLIPGPDGGRYVCSGHPEWPSFVEDPVTDPAGQFPWGPIRTYCGPWDGSPDQRIEGDPNDPIDQGTRTTEIICPKEVDVRAVYECVQQVVARIAQCRLRYGLIDGPNSNTVVSYAMSHCAHAAGCRLFPSGNTPRTGGRLPIGWDSEEGLRIIEECVTGAQPPIAAPPRPPNRYQ